MDIAASSITELSAAIRGGRLSPVAIVDAFLARIAERDAALHAFTAVYGAEARLAAEGADRAIRSGHGLGALHGIPIALKDLVEIDGRVTTGGSRAWANRVSNATATVVRRLIEAGMIILGKTHTAEFAMGAWGTNFHMGTPRNPWDLKVHRTPGGSSSGSGVAVTGGLVPAALGTDTGGSVRLPAALCGIVGLRPTVGRISTYGVLPLSRTLDTVGPMARSVEDVAWLFRALSGPDERDPQTLGHPRVDPLPTLRRGVVGLRLAVLPEGERAMVDRDILAAFDASVETLAALGAEIVPARLPHLFEEYSSSTIRLICTEGYRWVGHLVDDPDQPLDPNVRRRFEIARDVSARDYLTMLTEREERVHAFAAAMAGIDALLTPTAPTAATAVNGVDESASPSYFTRSGSYLGLCGLAVPNGFTAEGLPTSLHILCHGYDEATALRIGWAYEAATTWHQRRPPEP
jgi:aspartyl-tRNA(Asn)/glutamyl-tRNA(Gln) amidotransferase subunit A